MRKTITIIAIGMSVSFCQVATSQTTWYVAPPPLGDDSNPGTEQQPFATIQKGIDAASDADTVIVAEATYKENIHFDGKNIILTSEDPLDDQVVQSTIIDGQQSATVVTFAGTEDQTCLLSGFTIQNGTAMYGGGISGGTGQTGTRATIKYNIITGNFADYGGGIRRCDGVIQNNTISRNSAYWGGGLDFCNYFIDSNTISTNEAKWGGGLRNCDAIIQRNTISDNSATEEGGGLHSCDGMIVYNLITGNEAAKDGGGLAFCENTIKWNTVSGNSAGGAGGGFYSCGGTIDGNIITENSSQSSGGGLCRCHGTIEENTITGNSAIYHGGGLYDCDGEIYTNMISENQAGKQAEGGGLAYCDGEIHNNTIVGNSSYFIGGALSMCWASILNCIVWGNSAPQLSDSLDPSYSCIQDWVAGGEGNISGPPGFLDFAGKDYRLAEGSPCIDAGTNQEWMHSDTRDLEGKFRLVDGDSDGLKIVDMGAYEYYPFSIVYIGPEYDCLICIVWTCRPNATYTVWSCPDLRTATWNNEGTTTTFGWGKAAWYDPNTTSTRKFYRIELSP